MYYGFGALNFFMPIISTALIGKCVKVSSWLSFTLNFLWIFTIGVLFVALWIIKRSLKAESRVVVNFKAMFIHFLAFAIYGAQTIYAMTNYL